MKYMVATFLSTCALLLSCGGGSAPVDRTGYDTDQPALVPAPKANDTIALSFGSYAGECDGYCRTSYALFPTIVHRTAEPWRADTLTYPVQRRSISIPQARYDSVFAQLDPQAFLALEDRIGCPDCADGGAQWIAISYPSGRKTVVMEEGASLPAIAGLMEALLAIRMDPRWPPVRE